MNIADDLCRAFCEGIEVHSVPAGLAVGTSLVKPDGDRIGFYLVRGEHGLWRIEDDGFTIPLLIGSGVNVEDGERAAEFDRMIGQAGVIYDNGDLRTEWLREQSLPDAALRFASLLLRVNDLAMLHPAKVRKTFREDAMAAITQKFTGAAEIDFDAPVAEGLADFKADAVLRHGGMPPLAVFLGTSDNRIYEAILARQLAKQQGISVRVAALLESERPVAITLKVQQRARNYLDASPSFVGNPEGAMIRLAETAGLDINARRALH